MKHNESPGRIMRGNNNQEQQTQFVVTGRIKPTNVGTEVISFSFRLGPIKVICIVNVPGEDTEEAPAYIKFELVKPEWKASPVSGDFE